MNIAFGLRLALLAILGAGASGILTPATATQFGQRDVNSDRLIAIAAPIGTSSHQLLILEQVSDRRPCWRESGSNPTLVEPLLLNFDFTGICSRSTDSNGYSVRVNGQDLGLQYSLRIVRQANDLVLMAVPGDRNSPALEVGRTNGITSDFARIDLSPDWRMARRVYNGQPLSHIYLTNNQDLPTLIAAAAATQSATRPSTPARPPTSQPLPVTPPEPLPTVTIPPRNNSPLPAPSPIAASPGLSYRVVVQADTAEQQTRVRAIAPGAFRTTVNGREVMQAGIFRNQETANRLRLQLGRENLMAWVTTDNVNTVGSRPQPTPSTPPRPSSPGDLPQVPRGRTVVVIDPGHGGRDPGAIGIDGLREKDIVFPIAQQVAALLEQQGVQAIMTRQDDRDLELAPRVALADRVDANLFVSIHANSVASRSSNVNGVETFYASSDGQRLAQSIQNNIIQTTGAIDRGVKPARFYVLTRTTMPAALVEVGFVTGTDDARRLSNVTYRSQIAGAITRGILQHIQRN